MTLSFPPSGKTYSTISDRSQICAVCRIGTEHQQLCVTLAGFVVDRNSPNCDLETSPEVFAGKR